MNINKLPNVDLNDADEVRNEIISLVDDYRAYDFSDNEQRAKGILTIDDIFRCFYKNGFFTYDYDENEMNRIKKDAGDIMRTPKDDEGEWRKLHSEQVFDSHPGTFVILIVRHMLCYSGKTGQYVIQNKYWPLIARKTIRFVMEGVK